MGVSGEIRHKKIIEQLGSNGKILVSDLAQMLQVTEVTIRRDLVFLEKNGMLKKTYGGAVLPAPEMDESVRFRQKRRMQAKKIVGRLAAELIRDGDIIYLEAGSTCCEIVPYLVGKKGLTIIVNSLFLMRTLGRMAGHKIVVVGGIYRPDRMDMVGPQAEAAIAGLSGYRAFTSADAIDIETGISGVDPVTVGFAKLVLKRANEVIFVGDDTKFDNPALYKIADLDKLNCIITNHEPAQRWKRAAEDKKIRLMFPGC